MTNARLMTAEEAFCYCVNKYPSLYASLSERCTRMQVYDQLFNVLGNGCSDEYGLARQFTWTMEVAHLCVDVPDKYMGPQEVFEGFTETIEDNHESCGYRPKYASRLPVLCTELEKELYPQAKCWRLREKGEGLDLYPNFQAAFSLVHNINLNNLDPSWVHAARYYYQEAQVYFSSPQCADTYMEGWPSDLAAQNSLVQKMEQDCYGMDKQRKLERWETISTNYGVAYKGDTALFLQEKWESELPRIQQFLADTLALLDEHLAMRGTPTTSPLGP